MLSLLKKIVVTLVIGLVALNPKSAWSDEDCVTCGIRPDPTESLIARDEFGRFMGMSGVKCDKEDFTVNFCGAFDNTQEIADVQEWIGRCKHLDAQGRTTLLELLDTMNCESDMIRSVANSVDGLDPETINTNIPAGSFLLYDSSDVFAIVRFYKSLVRHYYNMGKDSGLTELKEFARVLNEKDDNNFTFLDNVLVRWNDNYTDSVGFRNPRDQMIKALCNVGATFSSAENNTRFECEINPRIMGNQ